MILHKFQPKNLCTLPIDRKTPAPPARGRSKASDPMPYRHRVGRNERGLGFTPPSPLIFTPTGFGSHLYTAQRSDRAVKVSLSGWSYVARVGFPCFGLPSLTLCLYYSIAVAICQYFFSNLVAKKTHKLCYLFLDILHKY